MSLPSRTTMAEKLFQKLINSVSNKDLVKKSFEILEKTFQDERTISHSLRVALILSEMKLDSNTISAALLHDVLDTKPSSLRERELEAIKRMTNSEISFLVKKSFEVNRIRYPFSTTIDLDKRKEIKVENLRKMFLAIAEDLRVILIKFASRLDHLRNLRDFSSEEKRLYSFETFEVFIPVAERLGIWWIKSEMEDLSFSYLYPKEFEWINKSIKEKYTEREKYLKNFTPILKTALKKGGIKPLEIKSRAKTYWSSWQKFLKYGMNFEKVYDLIGTQIILKDVKECYKALGILHQNWPPLSKRIKDFIANPKPNGYRALHTTLITKDGKMVEIQIKTSQMQREADFGICAHWAYKEKIDLKKKAKLFNLLSFLKKTSKDEIFENFEINFFEKRVFVFTPKDEVISLSKGSTPVDFAYAIHTDIGNHCGGVRINGKLSLLSKILENGDIVEIIVDEKRTPSRDWLKFIKTDLAKKQIKKWFTPLEVNESQQKHKENRPQEKAILPKISLEKEKVLPKKLKREKYQITLAGQTGISMNIAKCCNPQLGEEIKGYITKNRGATIHKIDCKNFIRLAKIFPSKTIKAKWSFLEKEKIPKPVSLKILAKDRIGLLKDISMTVSSLGLNISKYHGETKNQKGLAHQILMEIEIKNQKDLEKLLKKIRKIKGVISVKT